MEVIHKIGRRKTAVARVTLPQEKVTLRSTKKTWRIILLLQLCSTK